MPKNYTPSLRLILDARRSSKNITREEVKEFYNNSIKPSLEFNEYFNKFISAFNGIWSQEGNKKLFFQYLIELDMKSQLHQQYKSRPLEKTFFFQLFADKFQQFGLVKELGKLIKSSEGRETIISSTLSLLLEQYIASCKEAQQLGVEILGDLGFVYRIFQQTIHMLTNKYTENTDPDTVQRILLLMDNYLQQIDASYNMKGLKYTALPLAQDQKPTLECDLTDNTMEIVDKIGASRIKDCESITVALSTREFSIDKWLPQVKMLLTAQEWRLTGVNCAAVYLLTNVLKKNAVIYLALKNVAETLFEDFENNLTKCTSLKTVVIENTAIHSPLTSLFRGSPSLQEIVFRDCFIQEGLILAFDALQLNPYLKKLELENCGKIEFPYILTLLSSPFSGTTDETLEALSKLKDSEVINTVRGYYLPGDYTLIPENDTEIQIENNLFLHMLHLLFEDKYKAGTPDPLAGSLQMWLKPLYAKIIPKEQLTPLTSDQEGLLKSFRKFITSDEPLKSNHAPVASIYCKPLLAKAHTPETASQYPFLPTLVKWMIDDICFQRGLRVPSKCEINSLSLNGVQLCEYSGGAFAAILVSYKFLTHLDLYDNAIGNEGTIAIADALMHNKGLESLILSKNGVEDIGATAIAEALLNNSTLKILVLCENKITDLGAGKILLSLLPVPESLSSGSTTPNNTTLTKLNLNKNPTTSEVKEICIAIGTNPSLESVTINGENVVHIEDFE